MFVFCRTITRALGLSNYYWIGLSDQAREGDWRWVNGYRSNTDDSSLWNSGRPTTSSSSATLDCARSYFRSSSNSPSQSFFIYDVGCTATYSSICEKLI